MMKLADDDDEVSRKIMQLIIVAQTRSSLS